MIFSVFDYSLFAHFAYFHGQSASVDLKIIGKPVSAVTHVLINYPTAGYEIFIENMLSQMGDFAS